MASQGTYRAVGILVLVLAGCGAGVGEPCEEGDECSGGLVCFEPQGGSPTCEEVPAACEDQDAPCACEELLAQCELGHACVNFGDTTTLSCTQ